MNKRLLPYIRYIGDGVYHIYIQKADYECNFIRYATIYKWRREKGMTTANYIHENGIYAPFTSEGEGAFVSSFDKEEIRKGRLWLAIDTCLNRPSRLIEALEVQLPAYTSLPKNIGQTMYLTTNRRAKQQDMRKHVANTRLNIKEQMEYLLKKYRQANVLATAGDIYQAKIADKVIGEEYLQKLVSLDYFIQYNDGLTVKQIDKIYGPHSASYYEWFIEDFGLPKPTGIPPEPPYAFINEQPKEKKQ